jgi:hypothetical protein
LSAESAPYAVETDFSRQGKFKHIFKGTICKEMRALQQEKCHTKFKFLKIGQLTDSKSTG